MNTSLIKNIFSKAENYIKTKNIEPEKQQEYLYNKFAELLISECAEICTNFRYSTEGPSEIAAYQRSLCKFAIKEHFEISSKGPLNPKVIR